MFPDASQLRSLQEQLSSDLYAFGPELILAVEMASVPSYALAGFLKGRSTGSEAALKYVVFGAAASGVMLYGISLITAKVGTGYLPSVAKAIALGIGPGGIDLPLAAGLLL